jgi:hypothetical protein
VPASRRISSRQHTFVERCRALARHRDGGTAILLDGEHLVREALRAELPIEGVLSTDTAPVDLTNAIDRRGVPHYRGTTAVLETVFIQFILLFLLE